MISTLDEYLDEVIAMQHGMKIRRRDELSISRLNYLREVWPIAHQAGYKKAVADGLKAPARAKANGLPKGVMP
ncbi:Phage protein [Sodalis praecaptivus]|uniref:Phage protein n=1 Tax=Sodalis praecaptivus TaxID=1239307 RepID=W0HVU3_9GAMM|nr:hypothetical protein [Sodalis praecaptivus]AHF77951.1 Phage protein [Sodalis praecaptivus]